MELENSKLITLLKSFNKPEFKKFEDYILSPFFNTSQQITALFEMIKEKYPHFQNLDKKYIYKKIYPRSSYDDKKIRDLFSRMLKLTEEFLAQMEIVKKSPFTTVLTLKALAEKNLEKHFISKSKEAELLISKEKTISLEYFLNKYSISREKRSYLETLEALGKRTSFFEGITEEIDYFVIYSIYNILKYALVLQTHERLIKHKHQFKALDYILNFIRNNPLNNYPVIMILYYIIILNRGEGNEKIYFDLKKLLNENLHTLEVNDQREILIFIFNYTQIEATKGSQVFIKENYEILKSQMEMGLYPIEGKYFTDFSYITTVATALKHKDYKWAETFMEVYKNELPPEKKENAYNYCVSILNYRIGNHREALEGLSKISLDDFYYHLRVKNNVIRIFFELGDYENVLFTIDSFRHFLTSNALLPDLVKIRYINYVNFTSRAANMLLSGHNNEKLTELKQEIKNHDSNFENRIWLLEQLEKIRK